MKKFCIIIICLSMLVMLVAPGNSGIASGFNLQAKPGCNFIDLSWDSVPNVKGYFIYRGIGTGNQAPEPLTDFPIKETSYRDETDIEKNNTYCYVVKAVGTDLKEFSTSNEACAKSLCPEDCTLTLKFKIGTRAYWKNDVPQPEMSSAPIIQWQRTFLLIRYVAESIGAKVDWEASSKTVTITTKDGNVIKLVVGKNKGYVNGKEVPIDANNSKVTPIIVDGRTLCPLRFTGFNLGATGPEDILWDPDTQMAILKFKNPDCGDGGGGSGGGGDVGGGGGSGGGSGSGGGAGGSGGTVGDNSNVIPGSPSNGSGSYNAPKGNAEKTEEFTSGLGNSWVQVQGGGGDFAKHVSFSGGEMIVNAPEGSWWGKAGIRSKEPYFTVGADPYSIVFEVDQAKTNGFIIALSDTGRSEDPWNIQNVWISFHQSPNSSQASFGMSNFGNPKETSKSLNDIDHKAPEKLTVTVKSGSVSVCTSFGYSLTGNYAWLKPGTKVYLYTFASSIDGEGQPVKYGLKSIKGFKADGCSGSSSYTPPYNNLVFTEEFDKYDQVMWTPVQGGGGDFKADAKFEGGAFNTSHPKYKWWGKTGLKSKYYFLHVTEEMKTHPYTILLDVDPSKTNGFVSAISTANRAEDPWNVENVWMGFHRHEYNTQTIFNMSNSANNKETIVSNGNLPVALPSKVAITIWPGKVKLTTSQGFTAEGNYAWIKPGAKIFLYFFNHPLADGMSSQMSVKSVKVFRSSGATFAKWSPPFGLQRLKEDFTAGDRDGMWKPIEGGGGNFKKFASFVNGGFVVDVPEKNWWGKTGIK